MNSSLSSEPFGPGHPMNAAFFDEGHITDEERINGFTRRELSTVLAALRLYQQEKGCTPALVDDIATNGGTEVPMRNDEIDALCERLNEATEKSYVVTLLYPDHDSDQYGETYATDAIGARSVEEAIRLARMDLAKDNGWMDAEGVWLPDEDRDLTDFEVVSIVTGFNIRFESIPDDEEPVSA